MSDLVRHMEAYAYAALKNWTFWKESANPGQITQWGDVRIVRVFGAMSGVSDIGDKMDVWASLWPTQAKVHKSVVRSLTRQIGLFTRFSTIWTMVELSGIEDECDKLETTRALRDIRDGWRKSYDPVRKAITA